jgi:hypothetical protein
MTKIVSLCLLLQVAVVLSQPAQCQAATRCMHMTNFCDSIMFQISGTFVYGGWDAFCEGDWKRSSILGKWKTAPELGTHPVYPFSYYFVYSMQFSFKPGKLFDLYGTSGIANGVFAFDSNQPYTITDGACRGTDVDKRKPRLISRIAKSRTATTAPVTTRCLHFTNYCDTIVLAADGPWLYGNWDFQCTGDWKSNNIIGNKKAAPELTTRAIIPYLYNSPYTSRFSFKANQLFDLYETAGLGMGVFAAKTNEPYTLTDGACGPEDVDHGKPKIAQ